MLIHEQNLHWIEKGYARFKSGFCVYVLRTSNGPVCYADSEYGVILNIAEETNCQIWSGNAKFSWTSSYKLKICQ